MGFHSWFSHHGTPAAPAHGIRTGARTVPGQAGRLARRIDARAVVGAVSALVCCTAGLLLPRPAMAQQSGDIPSVVGHSYDDLPSSNPTVTKTAIDNSSKPSYLRNPIGQDEGTDTPDDLTKNYYSADASTLDYDGKLFVYTGHDEAAPDYGSFNMKDWGVYVTDDPSTGKWMHYKDIAQANLFDWATGEGAYAGQVAVDDHGTSDKSDDTFYYYVPVQAKNATGDPFAIGVAVSSSPLGPWKDALGHPLLTTAQTGIETIDPAYFRDPVTKDNYLYFGTFNSQLAVKMARDASGRSSFTSIEQDGSGSPRILNMRDADAVAGIKDYDPSKDVRSSDYAGTVERRLDTGAAGGSYANGPKGFFEASWVVRHGSTYYNIYDGGKPGSGTATCVESNYQACIEYSTSSSPIGPWKFGGVILGHGSATTMHPSLQEFKGKWYITYHTGDKKGGTDFRRAVCIDEVHWKDGKIVSQAHPTFAERLTPSRNVAPFATPAATFTETPSWLGSVNDGRVLVAAVVPPDHWDNYRSVGQPQGSDTLYYTWPSAVRVSSSKVWFDVDGNALRAPASWKMSYLDSSGNWKEVPDASAYTTTTGYDKPNTVKFSPVTTTALKIELTAQAAPNGGYMSVAVPEWQVFADTSVGSPLAPQDVTTRTGTAPVLPSSVRVSAGSVSASFETPVVWRMPDPSVWNKAGTVVVHGVVAGVGTQDADRANVSVTVHVGDDAPAAPSEAPKVSLTIDGVRGHDGWLVSSPVALVNADGGSGAPARIELSSDGGATWRTVSSGSRTAAASLAGTGTVSVSARAVMPDGSLSAIASASAKVDTTAPVVTPSIDTAKRSLTLSAADADSGVATISYRRQGGRWTAYTGPVAAAGTAGEKIDYRAEDKAGNVSAVATAALPSDPSVPLTGWIEKEAEKVGVTDGVTSGWTHLSALNDGVALPQDNPVSNDILWGTWPNTGEMWVQYTWDRPVRLDSSRVQFVSDSTDPAAKAGLQIPASWKLQTCSEGSPQKEGTKASEGSSKTATDQMVCTDIPDASYTIVRNDPSHNADTDAHGWSVATWPKPVTTSVLRLVMKTASAEQGSGSPAIVEWGAHAVAPEPAPVDTSKLRKAVDSAARLAQDEYTPASYAKVSAALAAARQVLADAKTTQAKVDAALAALQSAVDGLERTPSTPDPGDDSGHHGGDTGGDTDKDHGDHSDHGDHGDHGGTSGTGDSTGDHGAEPNQPGTAGTSHRDGGKAKSAGRSSARTGRAARTGLADTGSTVVALAALAALALCAGAGLLALRLAGRRRH